MSEQSHTYFAAGRAVAAEADRLQRLDGFYAASTRAWLTGMPGFSSISSVVEFGAGYGGMLDWFARQVGPEGDILGVDVDLSHIKSPTPPIRHLKADILDPARETGAFDLAFARLVLMHVGEPAQALERMIDWVKPGGRIAVADLDCSTARPVDLNAPGMTDLLEDMEHMRRALRRSGLMDPDFGGRLGSLFATAGLTDITVETIEQVIEGGSEWARFMAESNLVAAKALNALEIGRRIADAFLTPGLRFHDQALVCVTGRRPS